MLTLQLHQLLKEEWEQLDLHLTNMGSTQRVLLSCLARGSQGKERKVRGEHEVQEQYPEEAHSAGSSGSHQSKGSLFSICLCETFLLPAPLRTQALAMLGRAAGKLWPHRGLGQTFRK